MKRIFKLFLIVGLVSNFFFIKIYASTPAEFHFQGPTVLKQGQTATYQMVITDGDAIFLVGNLSLFDKENASSANKIFEFVSFEGKSGITYDAVNDFLYAKDKNDYAITVKAGEIPLSIVFKVKDNATPGTYYMIDNTIVISEKDVEVPKSSEDTTPTETTEVPKSNDDITLEKTSKDDLTTKDIILFSLVGLVLIISSVQTIYIIKNKQNN